MFRNRSLHLKIDPQNGTKVLARARVSMYEPRGNYQLIIEHMEDAGQGLLQKNYEILKAKLADEGLFDAGHKKTIPSFPSQIGVITSPSGAAIRDIIHVLERRCPQIPVCIYPVTVQGDKAAPELEKAIQLASSEQRCDVIILARGGGSIEDLWAFNEEAVARAVFESEIPIISGVGHEIDFTICDFVSDKRAPTPSAAAELASPDAETLNKQLHALQGRLEKSIRQTTQQFHERLQWLGSRLKQYSAENRLQTYAQRLDEQELRLHKVMRQKLEKRKLRLNNSAHQLSLLSPATKLQQNSVQLTSLYQHLERIMHATLSRHAEKLHMTSSHLHAVSPLATMQRGYSIAKKNNEIIRSIEKIRVKDGIEV